MPVNVNSIPIGIAHGDGCLSNSSPTNGWQMEADSWFTNVIKPICAKLKAKSVLSNGYTDVMVDCIVSFKQCDNPNPINMGSAIFVASLVCIISSLFKFRCKGIYYPINDYYQ